MSEVVEQTWKQVKSHRSKVTFYRTSIRFFKGVSSHRILSFQFLLRSFPANFSNSLGVNHWSFTTMHFSPEIFRERFQNRKNQKRKGQLWTGPPFKGSLVAKVLLCWSGQSRNRNRFIESKILTLVITLANQYLKLNQTFFEELSWDLICWNVKGKKWFGPETKSLFHTEGR